MGDVSLSLAREFFETHGFLVTVNRKYALARRGEVPGADLYVVNSRGAKASAKSDEDPVMTGRELGGIERAAVSVKGWHTDVFSTALLERAPDVLDFCRDADLAAASRFFGGRTFSRVLVLSRLPKTKDLRAKAVHALAKAGVTHILEFSTILRVLANEVKTNKNYDESDVLQMLRLLKVYNLVAEDQLSLFPAKRKKRSK